MTRNQFRNEINCIINDAEELHEYTHTMDDKKAKVLRHLIQTTAAAIRQDDRDGYIEAGPEREILRLVEIEEDLKLLGERVKRIPEAVMLCFMIGNTAKKLARLYSYEMQKGTAIVIRIREEEKA